MGQVFISYAREQESRELAERLGEELRRRGFDPWMDVTGLKPGAEFLPLIERAMKASQACVLLLAPGRFPSKEMQEEHREALEQFWERDLLLIPVRMRGAEVPSFLLSHVVIDVSGEGDWDAAVGQIVGTLQTAHANKPFTDESALTKARLQQEERLSYIEQCADSLDAGHSARE